MAAMRTKPAKQATTATVAKKAPKKVTKLVAAKPRISEKGYNLAEQLNVYTFVVPADANKHSVAQAIESQYEVSVTNVRVASIPGKVKRSYRRGGRNVFKGTRSDLRKAYVTLAEGDKLPIFSAVEEGSAPDKETK
jgi:ribosomal protein L23